MLPLALAMKARGYDISGSDRSYDQGRVPERFNYIKAQGITLYPQDGSGVTRNIGAVVVSGAVEKTVPDYKAALDQNIPIMTRAELLSDTFNKTETCIGIAGTSGKSTVTGMAGWILACAAKISKEEAPTIINGATMKNFVSDTAPFASALLGSQNKIIAEIDESDGSIAHYNPTIAVINNVAHDHKSMDELRTLFSDFAQKADKTILNLDNEETRNIAKGLSDSTRLTYSLNNQGADLFATNFTLLPYQTSFDLAYKNKKYPVTLAVPGHHNAANALAALGVVISSGVDIELAIDALGLFTGITRRYDVVGQTNGITVIDDFAHNPDKIAATLHTLQQSDGRVQILFQPHGFGPLALLRKELATSFAKGMKPEDVLIICDPLYLGGSTSRKVTSEDLVKDIMSSGKNAVHMPDRNDAAEMICNGAKEGDKIVVMGARDDSLTTLAHSILDKLSTQ